MLDIDTEELLVEKLGGKFKLTTLIQRRLVELNRGVKALVEPDRPAARPSGPPKPQELVKLIVKEILADKIALAPKSELDTTMEEAAEALQKDGAPEIDIFGEELKKIKEERLKELTTILQPSLGNDDDMDTFDGDEE
ncbi:MAG TPA: hypothetical protein PKX48_10510 [Planctomycetota bacterium]|jgi:DNA-directed RNA polymerase subunit omega|nr:hypothetical protein [Planctomycetota bacterium]OQC21743.1 MAG: hypothetical protein BWX69_00673 [Planctomycetes bacterium ADurb.Bin069]NMD35542.1 hypothetical protein [Planctomycetota bacterium]HNR98877.1 hypothetical protein [Planctomycetota bacterium]HNU26048.1 hypothetical protein [Planctomycetota bacterium]